MPLGGIWVVVSANWIAYNVYGGGIWNVPQKAFQWKHTRFLAELKVFGCAVGATNTSIVIIVVGTCIICVANKSLTGSWKKVKTGGFEGVHVWSKSSYAYIHSHTRTNSCLFECMRVCLLKHMHTYTLIFACLHTYLHTR